MRKSQLRTGMVVKLKNGGLYRVLLDTPAGDLFVNGDGHMELHNFNDDLCNQNSSTFNIMEIHSGDHAYQFRSTRLVGYDCIAKRDTRPSITLANGKKIQISQESYDNIVHSI